MDDSEILEYNTLVPPPRMPDDIVSQYLNLLHDFIGGLNVQPQVAEQPTSNPPTPVSPPSEAAGVTLPSIRHLLDELAPLQQTRAPIQSGQSPSISAPGSTTGSQSLLGRKSPERGPVISSTVYYNPYLPTASTRPKQILSSSRHSCKAIPVPEMKQRHVSGSTPLLSYPTAFSEPSINLWYSMARGEPPSPSGTSIESYPQVSSSPRYHPYLSPAGPSRTNTNSPASVRPIPNYAHPPFDFYTVRPTNYSEDMEVDSPDGIGPIENYTDLSGWEVDERLPAAKAPCTQPHFPAASLPEIGTLGRNRVKTSSAVVKKRKGPQKKWKKWERDLAEAAMGEVLQQKGWTLDDLHCEQKRGTVIREIWVRIEDKLERTM
ncbi:hypothetical protein FRB90_002617 [Tulasnella sp. 427]|nr:hypothetical protein FRB90_002617 [Tulasnella sp. 427]